MSLEGLCPMICFLALKLLPDPKQHQKDICPIKNIFTPSCERAGAVRRCSLASSLTASLQLQLSRTSGSLK